MRGAFLENAFSGEAPRVEKAAVGRAAYVERVVRGGFPEAVKAAQSRRRRFFSGYVDSILGRELGIDHKTVANHLRALEQLFMIVRLPAWHANLGHRVVRTAKLHVADTGMLCSPIGVNERHLEENGTIAGSVFETFVVNEVVRQASVSELGPLLNLYHYRDQRGHEVDLVVEHAGGDVVAIEIEASATPRLRDAAGLGFLRDRLGRRFRLGIVLHLGSESSRLATGYGLRRSRVFGAASLSGP